MAKKSKLTVSANTVYTKKYETFRGVDFSKDEFMVDDEHSPNAKNLISDTDGFPEKRIGWRTLKNFGVRINGVYSFDDGKNNCTVVHAGDKMYKISGDEETLLIEGIADAKSTGKYFKGKLCILTGQEYLVFDGESCVLGCESDETYAPITHISREAVKLDTSYLYNSDVFKQWRDNNVIKNNDGTAVNLGTVPDGGQANLVSGKRRNTFEYSCNYRALFILDEMINPGTRVTMRCISTGEEIFSKVCDLSQEFEYKSYRIQNPEGLDGIDKEKLILMESNLTSNNVYLIMGNIKARKLGFVVCNIDKSKLTDFSYTSGVDNFSIEFTHEYEGYKERINKCSILDVFENRVFFSGNPEYPHVDWYSRVNDPLFVPDINYTEIGMDSSRIMGYLRTGSEQAILKSDGDDATIYMRSYSTLSDGSVIFPIKQGTSGIGAVSTHAICTFLDDPMYLTRNGVYAIGKQDIWSERALNLRSTRVNRKLINEKELSEAVMCEWNGYLILCINGVAYVADAAQKQYPLNMTNTFEYEWYYWTNIPARVLYEHGGELFFGTEDGRLCKFNTDLVNSCGELEAEAYSDDGEAIVAEWATNLSDDGDFMQEKTLVKTGSGVLLKTYNRSGVSVFIRTDKDSVREITSENASTFNFENLSSSELTLNAAPYSVVPFNSRIKKYSAIQVICRNDKANHAFGVGGIVRRYFYGKVKK